MSDNYERTEDLARDVVRALGYDGGEILPAEELESVHTWLAESADLDETLATDAETLAAEYREAFDLDN